MPNVPESPNFEAIIATLAIFRNEAGFQLQPSGDTRAFNTSVNLLIDSGIPQGLIQTSEYGLLKDSGIPQGLIQTSQYGLTVEVARLNASENLELIGNVVVNIADQDFDIGIDSGVPLLFDDLSLASADVPKIVDDLTLIVTDDVRILFETDLPVVPPVDSGDDIAKITQQELLLGIFRPCRPCHRYDVNNRAKNRYPAR
jgi:hypothetical protein